MNLRHLGTLVPLLALAAIADTLAQQHPSTPAALMHDVIRELEENGRDVNSEVYPSLLYVGLSDDAPLGDTNELLAALSNGGITIVRLSSFGSHAPAVDLELSVGSSTLSGRLRAEARLARYLVVQYTEDIPPSFASKVLQKNRLVRLAEPVPIATVLGGATPSEPNDPRIPEQGQLAYIRAEQAWQVHAGDSSVIIGIVDAGVTQTNEDLRGNIAPNNGETGLDDNSNPRESNGVDDDENGYVDDAFGVNLITNDGRGGGDTKNGEHGTQVSGYAAADTDNGIGIAGIANQCRFYPMKAATFNRISIIGGFDGLLYAARAGFKVVNLSWGQPVRSEVEEELIQIVVEDFDVAVVGAGGNLNELVQFYPAGYRHVLGVGGVDQLSNVITTWGEHLDVVALAGLTTSGENEYFDLSSASSYATPIASGVVALARSKWPALSARGAIAHVRNQAVNVDNFNLGRVGFVGRGRLDALNVVSNDPMNGPGIQVDSVWVLDATGNRTKGLQPGESGEIRIAITNVLGDAEGLSFSLATYTADSSSVLLSTSPVVVGDLAAGASWSSEIGIPVSVTRPGTGLLPVRIDFTATGYQSYDYESIPVQQTYFVLNGSGLSVTMTTSARIGGDFGPSGIVGEGLMFNGINQLYEGGIIVSIDENAPLDNLRGTSQFSQNSDFVPIDPSRFQVPVLVAVEERTEGDDLPRIEIGSKGELLEEFPGLFRLRFYVHNVSGQRIDSVRFAWFGDWDLDLASGQQRVSQVDNSSLPAHLFPSAGLVESGLLSTLVVAVETGPRSTGDSVSSIFYANDNSGNPINILDGFSEEEKMRTVSNGSGSRRAGPADVSLTSGLVFAGLEPGGIDSVTLIFQFSSGGAASALERLIQYKESIYGLGAVDLSDLPERTIHVDGDLILISGEDILEVEIIDVLGRRVIEGETPKSKSKWFVDFSNLPSGRYFLLVRTPQGTEGAPIHIRR